MCYRPLDTRQIYYTVEWRIIYYFSNRSRDSPSDSNNFRSDGKKSGIKLRDIVLEFLFFFLFVITIKSLNRTTYKIRNGSEYK